MNVDIHPGWKAVLESEFEKPYFKALAAFVREEYKNHTCYPKGRDIFKAFDFCPLDEVKVVILGQDPYHGPGQAHGLCFSVPEGIAMPPSLINIFKELETDLNKPFPDSGNLEHWAKQGVLLLNATLTVRAHQAGSHQGMGWETFTDAVITAISENREGVIFLLWGGFAKKKASKINSAKHTILTSGHPSPLSANRGYWFGNRHFSKVNSTLVEQNKEPILW
ncbi:MULTISPECIES: uracil-DNA glycosylase [unclassified Leeuwenhoekiella]|uniref:uracil-DNA glycosylase n=1 Tax=unclassified Leeuwenhoekiella TaxID=2615029 RepID=UPI000C5E8D09|nr:MULTISPECIES: uracil-DNA glycosylase [unclassified Leeuwenhoekiella]MAW93786.1 uracil-DNA glycosylase [Leeuwenhoekiella sp.]MBA80560.1 uracil-DNA glycosylase [Leeuwenhoekiella sp.]|tara:strand:- start:1882 stop:2547 length:666 start_codon:yes stop_codon:yes gene_type:complete